MKSVLLTGIKGTVAQALQRQLSGTYDVSGLSIVRMDDVLRDHQPASWKEQLDEYRERVTSQLMEALEGKHAVAHLGWNTRDEHCGAGLDPLNILVVDCVYRAAIACKVPRIYMASSVHAYDFYRFYEVDTEPIRPFPDVREDPFGVPPTSLYGVSKRWMEIAGQYYAARLEEGQRILVVRLGGIDDSGRPHRRGSRLWDSHPDLAGLFTAFVECEEAPRFWVAFGVSDNHGEGFPRPLFDGVNPYGFTPADNAFNEE
jgi:nucleoside-diphosphate-sugar epimerase